MAPSANDAVDPNAVADIGTFLGLDPGNDLATYKKLSETLKPYGYQGAQLPEQEQDEHFHFFE